MGGEGAPWVGGVAGGDTGGSQFSSGAGVTGVGGGQSSGCSSTNVIQGCQSPCTSTRHPTLLRNRLKQADNGGPGCYDNNMARRLCSHQHDRDLPSPVCGT